MKIFEWCIGIWMVLAFFVSVPLWAILKTASDADDLAEQYLDASQADEMQQNSDFEKFTCIAGK